MPPKSKKRVSSSSYDSDGGFVAPDDGPATKKARTGLKSSATTKSAGSSGSNIDDEGNPYWEISKNRRVTVSSFRGKTMVSIREYYEKDGKSLPGKKGISLPIEHYTSLLTILPAIEDVLVAQGQTVPRPKYGTSSSSAADAEKEDGSEEDDAGEDDDGAEDDENGQGSTRKGDRLSKQNFEATSDEDEKDD